MATPFLTSREVYQILRDIALGVRVLLPLNEPGWASMACGSITVEADGWLLTLSTDQGVLDHCISCSSPDGRAYQFDTRQPYGSNPVALMSTWEHAQLLRLLGEV